MCERDQKPQINATRFWLLMAAFSLAFIPQQAVAAGEDRPPAKEQSVSLKATPQEFPDRITTLDGKSYQKVALVRVDPDGLLVNFVPVEGGSGSAKLKFRNLPVEWRDRFEYDAARASDYETAQARGEAVWRAESAAWTEQRRAAQAEQAAWERQMRVQTESRLAAEAEQAARNVAEPGYYYPGWWGPGWPGSFNHHPHGHGQGSHHNNNNHMHQQAPAAGIFPSPISPFIGPMRPTGR